MQRVLVTGGAGFIGSHLAERLLANGASVRVLDNFSTGHQRNLEFAAPGRIEVVTGDLRDPEAVRRAVAGVEVVFHEAALASVERSIADPALVNDVNVGGTLNLLTAAREAKVRRVVFAGSSSVYGNAADLPKHEEQRPVPISPYGVSKLAAEEYLRVFHHVYGLETVTLRYFNVFGPRQTADSEYAAVIPIFLARIFRGEQPFIYGDGEQSRDFTYIDDVVDANLRAAEAPLAPGQTINIACGRRHSVADLCQQLIAFAGADLEPIHKAPRAGDVRHSQADIARARTLLGYAPRVEFETGLRRTFDWFHSVSEEASAARRR
jgi:UDP-N-acetylglucosamine/UDP-N-acetyl-alpha-D-glucosaminouronate 4-epimerase